MSVNPTNGKRTFIAWCPDYTDEGAFARRMSVRPLHLEGIHKHVAAGYFKFGAYTLTADSIGKPVEDQVINGSNMVFLAESIEEVWGYVKADPYWENNVWDKEKVVVLPVVIPVQSS
ncbi:unnamed protein product [Peniophora sp. CBMAI 1063]|nr:unnamed protein product [Peniophora sp. CBMAI 1063]